MPASQVQIPAPFDEWYTITEAAAAMEYKHSQYVRKLLKDDKLGSYVEVETDANGQPVLDAEGAFVIKSGTRIKILVGKTEQWRIDPAACVAYKAAAAAGGGTFGQHAVRRMSLRFSTAHYTIEQITEALVEALGPAAVGEGEGSFRWEFTKAWKGGSKKKKSAKPGAPVMATIVSSLTNAIDDEDDDFDYDDGDDEDDGLDDVLS
jgi:hypothetical protein